MSETNRHRCESSFTFTIMRADGSTALQTQCERGIFLEESVRWMPAPDDAEGIVRFVRIASRGLGTTDWLRGSHK